MFRAAAIAVMWLASTLAAPTLAAADDLPARFLNPPPEAGMTTYWCWFGPAVTRDMIDRDLANMKQAHISGTVLLPVYPLSADDPAKGIRNLPFLSGEYLDILGYAGKRSHEKGMTLDVTLGTGWPYGGPWITPELGARMIRMRDVAQPLKPGEGVVATFGQRRVVAMPTGMMVKRPSIGNEGLVFDHYSPQAMNGRAAGVAWKRPYRLDVTGLVRLGPNTIEVKVTNLWINAMLGRPQPDYSALNAKFSPRFPEPAEWKKCRPLPSGLLGPVMIRTAHSSSVPQP